MTEQRKQIRHYTGVWVLLLVYLSGSLSACYPKSPKYL